MSDTFRIEIEMSRGSLDQDTIAGRLLTVFDRDGEAAMLNALHAVNPPPVYMGGGAAHLDDESGVTYIERLNCYAFTTDNSAPLLSGANALRPSVLETQLFSPGEELEPDCRILNLTTYQVLAEVITTLALGQDLDLPDDFTPHHGLVVQMAPNADGALTDVMERFTADPDNSYIEEKLRDIREMLARAVLATLPPYQVQQLKKTVENLATGD